MDNDADQCEGSCMNRRMFLKATIIGAGAALIPGLPGQGLLLAGGSKPATFPFFKGNKCKRCLPVMQRLVKNHSKTLASYFPEGVKVGLVYGSRVGKLPERVIGIGNCARRVKQVEFMVPGCAPSEQQILNAIKTAYEKSKTKATKCKEFFRDASSKKSSKTRKKPRRKTREDIAKGKFLGVYLAAARKFDFAGAERWGKRLAEDKRYPKLRRFGKDCEADMADMELFRKAVVKALLAAGTKKEQQLRLLNAEAVRGRITKVEKGAIHLNESGGRETQYPLHQLATEQLRDLFVSGYSQMNPPPKVLEALLYLIRGEHEQAEELFTDVRRQDKRAKHHEDLLENMLD